MSTRTGGGGRLPNLNREQQKLILVFGAILFVSVWNAGMMLRAWEPGAVIYDTVSVLVTEGLGVLQWQALQMLASGIVGLFLGLLFLFALDVRKRVQAALLLIGTALAALVLYTEGLFFRHFVFTYLPNWGAFGLSFVSALFIESDQLGSLDRGESRAASGGGRGGLRSLLSSPRDEKGDVREFNSAARGLFVLFSAVVLLSLVQVFLAGEIHPLDVVASGATVYLLYTFIQYKAQSDYMLIGPKESGKSMATLGMVMHLIKAGRLAPDENEYITDIIAQADDDEHEWPVQGNEATQLVHFQILAGNLFPRRMRLLSWDFPGHLLSRIPEEIEKRNAGRSLLPDGFGSSSNAFSEYVRGDAGVGGAGNGVGGAAADEQEQAGILAEAIIDADILLVAIDCRVLADPNPDENQSEALETSTFRNIIDSVDVDEVIVVATKADTLIHTDEIDSQGPTGGDSFRSFKRDVNEYMQQRTITSNFLTNVGSTEVQPVYFRTEPAEDSYIPVRDEDGDLVPVGFGRLLDRIEEAS